jgi:hypothetical protein
MKLPITKAASLPTEADPRRVNILATDADGREYTLLDPHSGRPLDVPTFIGLVIARDATEAGEIEAERWACRIPYGSNAWLIEGCEDRQIEDERWGW